jgi:hypothetical protein
MSDIDIIERNWSGVYNLLKIRQWSPPVFNTPNRVFTGILTLPIPTSTSNSSSDTASTSTTTLTAAAALRSYCYSVTDKKWCSWLDMIPKTDDIIPLNTSYSDIVVPCTYTVQHGMLVKLLLESKKQTLVSLTYTTINIHDLAVTG